MSTTDTPAEQDWESFVKEAFPRAIGADLASMCRPVEKSGDALVIEVTTNAVSHQLAFMEHAILHAAGHLGVSRIRIRHIKDVTQLAVQFWKTAPDILLLDDLNNASPIGATYEYIGVFVYEPENERPRHAVHLRLLYNLKEHTGDEAWNHRWSDHYAAFAARINDSWSNTGGYQIIAFKTFSDVRECFNDDEQRALRRESQHLQEATIAIGA